MIKLYFKNLWDIIKKILLIAFLLTYAAMVLLSVAIVFAFIFKVGSIPKHGWIPVALCVPSTALIKTIDDLGR